MLGLWWIIYMVKPLNITSHVQESSVRCQGFIKIRQTILYVTRSNHRRVSPDIDPSAEGKIHELITPSY